MDFHRLQKLADQSPKDFFNDLDFDAFLQYAANTKKHVFGKAINLVYSEHSPALFLNYVADLAYSNIKEIQSHPLYHPLSLEDKYKAYEKRHSNDLSDRIQRGQFNFKAFCKWTEILIVIASHKNTSNEKLAELSMLKWKAVSEIARIRIEYKQNDHLFWRAIALSDKPNLFLFLPKKLIYRLIQQPDISYEFMQSALQIEITDGMKNIISNHPNTPNPLLEEIVKSSNSIISETAKLHINYECENKIDWKNTAENMISRKYFSECGQQNEEGIEIRLWKAGGITEDTLPYLNQSSGSLLPSTLLRIACSNDVLQDSWHKMAQNQLLPEVIKDYVHNSQQREALFLQYLPSKLTDYINQATPTMSFDELHRKSNDKRWSNKYQCIKITPIANKDLIFSTLVIESFFKYTDSKCQITRKNLLNRFETDRNRDSISDKRYTLKLPNIYYYGNILASNPQTSSTILSKLVDHPLSGIRLLVAKHSNVSKTSLSRLMDDCNSVVKNAALEHPKLEANTRQILSELENPDFASEDLDRLYTSKNIIIRVRVARHQNTNDSILSKMVNDHFIVRLEIAKNPKTPANILVDFSNHPDKQIVIAVAQNPGTPFEILNRLATSEGKRGGLHFDALSLAAIKTLFTKSPESAITFLEKCLKFPERPSFSRFLLLMNPRIPTSFLSKNYQSWYWMERYAIAQNPNTDIAIRQLLTRDPNIIVRAAAKSILENNSN
jgi:hypothetical protein